MVVSAYFEVRATKLVLSPNGRAGTNLSHYANEDIYFKITKWATNQNRQVKSVQSHCMYTVWSFVKNMLIPASRISSKTSSTIGSSSTEP